SCKPASCSATRTKKAAAAAANPSTSSERRSSEGVAGGTRRGRNRLGRNVKLFQSEEPDGSPSDPGAPGAAVGIDVSGARAEVAISVGGNAVLLADRDGFELDLTVPSSDAPEIAWR